MVTYTTNKKLNKPAYGEFPNSWDVPVNEDWDIIDKALGGVATFTVGATDITLSISEAQNQRILLQGTPGVTRNIIIPFVFGSAVTAVGGMWIIDNQTNANQNIITEVSGSQGVTVTLGRRAIVYSNGTNVYFADDVRLISGTGISVSGSTVSLSVPVTTANGGTGRTSLTAGSVLIGDSTNPVALVAPGTAGNVLTSNGSTWTSAPATGGSGTGITSINFSTASGMGLTLSPASVTTSGSTVNLSGTLTMSNGGTGVSTIGSGVVKSNGATLSSGTVALGSEVTGTLPIGNGGTGATTFATGVVKFTGSALAGGQTVALGSEVSGTLPVANGGTGQTSLTGLLRGSGSSITGNATVALGGAFTPEVVGTLQYDKGGTGLSTLVANGALYANPSANGFTVGTLPVGSGGTGVTTAVGTGSVVLNNNSQLTGTTTASTISASTLTASGNVTGQNFLFTTANTYIGYSASVVSVVINGSNAVGMSSTNFAIPVNATVGSNLTISSNLQVNGTPFCATQANFTVTSDARTKKDVSPYTKSVSDVLSLEPKTFKYNGQYGTNDDGVTRVGLIAQDLLPTSFESMLGTHEYVDPATGQKTSIYNVNSSELIFAMINTIKDLDARVKALEAKVGPS